MTPSYVPLEAIQFLSETLSSKTLPYRDIWPCPDFFNTQYKANVIYNTFTDELGNVMMMNAKINNAESRTFLLVHIVTLMYLAVTNRITIPFVEIGIAVRDTIRFMKRGYYQSSGERRNAMLSSDRKFPSLSQVRHVSIAYLSLYM